MAVFDENRVTFTTETEDLRTKYVADVSNSESNYTFELLNYRFYGEDTENLDELGKLLAKPIIVPLLKFLKEQTHW